MISKKHQDDIAQIVPLNKLGFWSCIAQSINGKRNYRSALHGTRERQRKTHGGKP